MILNFSIGFLKFGFIDLLDILLVTFILFQLYKLVKGSVAVKIFIGILAVYLFYLMVNAAEMKLLADILGQVTGVGFLAVIILFQQEIRRFLIILGKSSSVFTNDQLTRLFNFRKSDNEKDNTDIKEITTAVSELAKQKMGALIVLAPGYGIKFNIESGDMIDAVVSKRLLISIFNKYSPLHDGAVIIMDNRIVAARCVMPVTERDDIPPNFGMRHRAAVGISESSDCIVIIVSEERGHISVALNGELKEDLSIAEVRKDIRKYFHHKEEEKQKKKKEKFVKVD